MGQDDDDGAGPHFLCDGGPARSQSGQYSLGVRLPLLWAPARKSRRIRLHLYQSALCLLRALNRFSHIMTNHFDAIIIGAGQAGPSLAGRLTQAGRKVAMIERKLFGGTCVNTGCTPTKTLVASAYAAHVARRGDFYGVNVGCPISVDMKVVKARMNEVVAK